LQNTAYIILKFLKLFNYTNAFFIAESSNEFYNNMFLVTSTILKNNNTIFQYTMKFKTFAVEAAGTVAVEAAVSQQINKLLLESQLSTRCKLTDFLSM
jgi:hypothetical protein